MSSSPPKQSLATYLGNQTTWFDIPAPEEYDPKELALATVHELVGSAALLAFVERHNAAATVAECPDMKDTEALRTYSKALGDSAKLWLELTPAGQQVRLSPPPTTLLELRRARCCASAFLTEREVTMM